MKIIGNIIWAQICVCVWGIVMRSVPPIIIPYRGDKRFLGFAVFGFVIALPIHTLARDHEDILPILYHEFRHTWQFWHHPLVCCQWIFGDREIYMRTYHTSKNALEADARAFAQFAIDNHGIKRISLETEKRLTLSFYRQVSIYLRTKN